MDEGEQKYLFSEDFDALRKCVIDGQPVEKAVLLKHIENVFYTEEIDGVRVRVRGKIKAACRGVGHVMVCEDCVRMIERIGADCKISFDKKDRKKVVKRVTNRKSIEFARHAIRKLFSRESFLA